MLDWKSLSALAPLVGLLVLFFGALFWGDIIELLDHLSRRRRR